MFEKVLFNIVQSFKYNMLKEVLTILNQNVTQKVSMIFVIDSATFIKTLHDTTSTLHDTLNTLKSR